MITWKEQHVKAITCLLCAFHNPSFLQYLKLDYTNREIYKYSSMLWEKCDLQWDRDVKESITMRPNSQTCSKQQANGNWVIDQTEEKNIVGNIKGSEALLSLSSYQPQRLNPPKRVYGIPTK